MRPICLGHKWAFFIVLALTLGACGKTIRTATTAAAPATSRTTEGTNNSRAPTQDRIVVATAQGITASMHPHSHHPIAGQRWPISFTVTRSGSPVQASVSYQYLFGGQVVARRSHYSFHGNFSDTFVWPDTAVGYPLTFRAVILASGVKLNLDYPVQVVK